MVSPPPLLKISQLSHQLREFGAKPEHEIRILRAWMARRPLDSGPRRQAASDWLPLAVRNALPDISAQLESLARVISAHAGEDDSERLLVGLNDGQTVESVLLPRDGVCVSTQVGCAVGCVFCMTGRDGLLRQLGSAEIVAQVRLAQARRPVRKVVFMGMGEPAHNLDNVLEAIDLLGTAGGIGHKNLVLSTVGDRRVFERLPEQSVRPALAVSLHSTDDEKRAALLPKAPRVPVAELVERAEIYARLTGYPIQYQWTLIEGVNDSEQEMEEIARLLNGKYAMMNLIPYNATQAEDEGTQQPTRLPTQLPAPPVFRRPSWERCQALVSVLRRHRLVATLRQSAGQDIEGGCGQLRARMSAENAANAPA